MPSVALGLVGVTVPAASLIPELSRPAARLILGGLRGDYVNCPSSYDVLRARPFPRDASYGREPGVSLGLGVVTLLVPSYGDAVGYATYICSMRNSGTLSDSC